MPENTPLLPEMSQLWQQTLNWQPNPKQQSQFQRLYELIIQGNQQLNLTRITEPSDFWEKHLWDSLRGIMPLLKDEQPCTKGFTEHDCTQTDKGVKPLPTNHQLKIIDIGTGAGFPGIPAAIALNHSQVTLLDSTRKKINFLNTLLEQMDLPNALTLIGRAEVVAKSQYCQFDIALIRAVGSASVCAEYALPLLKSGGLAILYRGNWTTDETETLQSTTKHLGGVIETIEDFTTPLSNSTRHCVYLRKGVVERKPLPIRVLIP